MPIRLVTDRFCAASSRSSARTCSSRGGDRAGRAVSRAGSPVAPSGRAARRPNRPRSVREHRRELIGSWPDVAAHELVICEPMRPNSSSPPQPRADAGVDVSSPSRRDRRTPRARAGRCAVLSSPGDPDGPGRAARGSRPCTPCAGTDAHPADAVGGGEELVATRRPPRHVDPVGPAAGEPAEAHAVDPDDRDRTRMSGSGNVATRSSRSMDHNSSVRSSTCSTRACRVEVGLRVGRRRARCSTAHAWPGERRRRCRDGTDDPT
jgi:hypothetical protein